MTEAWGFEDNPPEEGLGAGAVTLVEGSSFCISEPGGDIVAGGAHGLFVRDVRLLSRWQLRVDDVSPLPMTVLHPHPFAAELVSWVPSGGARGPASALLVVRRRYVGDGMREDLSLVNDTARAVDCVVRLAAGTDFADVFEVKGGRVVPGDSTQRTLTADGVRLSQQRAGRELGVLLRADQDAQVEDWGLLWKVTVPARSTWTTSIEVVGRFHGVDLDLRHPRGVAVEHTTPARRLTQWRRSSPVVETADRDLAAVLRRSVEDLGTLRIFDPAHPERVVVAAGAPWFMAPFGRDSLLTSWMVLPVDTSLALGTLQTLAEHQGTGFDADSEEEPGRIIHEMRFGPAAGLSLGGANAYYGTADAASLFVMLLGELLSWGAFGAEARALVPKADRALAWVERYGDLDDDGFVEYARKTERGLLNQGWKDSGDAINFADGTMATAPIALAEVQGYTYAAYLARARIARALGEDDGGVVWQARAEALKAAFNERFWLPDKGYFAVALDRDKRPVDSLTSNLGHCLWTGIVDDDKAASVVAHLMSDDMFSGWGIRTLATSMGAYDPMSYHNGSVWPHDNAICVSGLMRYGFVEEATRVVEAVLDAATHFGHRLPELFCGHSREHLPVPVPYPTSCAPQAWAAAAPLELVRAVLGFEPRVSEGVLHVSPVVPERYLPLRLSNVRLNLAAVPGRAATPAASMGEPTGEPTGEPLEDVATVGVEVDRGGWTISGLDGGPIRLDTEPPRR